MRGASMALKQPIKSVFYESLMSFIIFNGFSLHCHFLFECTFYLKLKSKGQDKHLEMWSALNWSKRNKTVKCDEGCTM